MQNTVTELSHRLLRSLDNNYNVIDMPAVVEIISALERTSITEELLKTTRLGKYINELRRKTSNEILAKRAKELLKKWRDQVLPSSQSSNTQHQQQQQSSMIATANGTTNITPGKQAQHQNVIAYNNERSNSPDLNLNRPLLNHKKRPLSSLAIEDTSNGRKRIKMNGSRHHMSTDQIYISDNSNSSPNVKKNTSLIVLNSDSNSSFSDRVPPVVVNETNLTFSGRNLGGVPQHPTPMTPLPPILQKPEPKKRGRKKGSKNHKTLLVQAEESFTNKMAVSVNSKVKTTQELLASIQNKTNLVRQPQLQLPEKKVISPKINNIDGVSSPKITMEGHVKNDKKLLMMEHQQRTASPKMDNKLLSKLTKERSDSPVKIDLDSENSRSSYQDSVVCITREGTSDDNESEVIDLEVVKDDDEEEDVKPDVKESSTSGDPGVVKSGADETVEDILAKLPKVDYSVLYEPEDDEDEPPCCTCVQPEPVENITIEFQDPAGGAGGVGGSIFDVPDEVKSETRTTIVKNEISVPHPVETESSVDDSCPAKRYLEQKYRLGSEQPSGERVQQLHTHFIDSINGNKCDKTVNQRYCDVNKTTSADVSSGLFSNIVPNFHNGEIIKKDITLESINYIKYKKILPYPLFCVDRTKCCDVLGQDEQEQEQVDAPSSSGALDADVQEIRRTPPPCIDVDNDHPQSSNQGDVTEPSSGQRAPPDEDKQIDGLSHDNFREFHECVSLRSYNDELLHILPYVVLD